MERAIYEDLGSCYVPSSHGELMKLLSSSEILPKSILGSLKFGYYMMRPNIPCFRHLLSDGESQYFRNGQPIARQGSVSSLFIQKSFSLAHQVC